METKSQTQWGTILIIILLMILLIVGIVIFVLYITKWSKPTIPVDCGYVSIPDTNIDGFNLPSMPIKDIAEVKCQDKCTGNKNCQWYNYDQTTRDCWLKQGKAASNYITGFRTNDEAQPLCAPYNKFAGYNIDGFFMPGMPLADKTEDECQAACDTQNCNWYNYDKSSKQCWLKKAAAKDKFVTGFRTIIPVVE